MTTPRIYVACLASYNNGILHGRWVDLDGTCLDEVRAEISEMLRESPYPNVTVQCPECEGSGSYCEGRAKCNLCDDKGRVPSAEEYAVHDSEDLPAGFRDTEWPDLSILLQRLEELEDLDDSERGAFEAFAEYESADATVERFRGCYIGEFDSWGGVAEYYVEETGMLSEAPEKLRHYFDYEKYGRELSFDGYESNGHFFWSR